MDKNMSRLNPLVTDCFVKLVVWLAEDTDISLTQPLCYRVNHPTSLDTSKPFRTDPAPVTWPTGLS